MQNPEIEKLEKLISDVINLEIKDFETKYEKLVNPLIKKYIKKSSYHIYPYKTITLSDKKKKQLIYHDIKLNDNGLRLYINQEIYYQVDLALRMISYDIIRQILSIAFNDLIAIDIAFGLIWYYEQDSMIRDRILIVWKSLIEEEKETDTLVYNFSNYIMNISKVKINYFHLFLDKFFKNSGEKLTKRFPYGVVELSFQYLSKNELAVLNAAIKNNTTNQNKIQEYTGLSKPTISKSIKMLEGLFILFQRYSFSPTKLGLTSVIGIITVPRGEGEKIGGIKYDLIKMITFFSGSVDTIYINFYIPSTKYALDKYESWLEERYSAREGVKLNILLTPTFGVELEEYRYNFQDPSLYNIDTEEWEIIEEGKEIMEIKELKKTILTMDEREIISYKINQKLSNEQIYKKIGGDRTKLFEIFAKLEDQKIVYQEYVLPFLNSLSSILVIYNGSFYEQFMKKISQTVPISVNFMIQNTEQSGDPRFSNRTGISFLSIPFKASQKIYNRIIAIDKKAKITFFPVSIGNTPKLESDLVKNTWKLPKFPNFYFNRI